MATNEGHIHWTGSASEDIAYLEQSLRVTGEVSNAAIVRADPIGSLRIREASFVGTGLLLPTEGWQAIPGTSPILEARMDAHYPTGLIRIRQA